MTASTNVSRSLRVDLARRWTWGIDSQNGFRSHKYSSQNHRRLSQRSTTGPAIGMSRDFWQRRFLTQEAITPQLGQPGGNVDFTVTMADPAREQDGAGDTIIRQIEDQAGSVMASASRL